MRSLICSAPATLWGGVGGHGEAEGGAGGSGAGGVALLEAAAAAVFAAAVVVVVVVVDGNDLLNVDDTSIHDVVRPAGSLGSDY